MRQYRPFVAAAAMVLWLGLSTATAQRQLTIGIVNSQLDGRNPQSFEPFTTYLAQRIPGAQFRIVELASIEDLVRAAERKQLDFAFATPSALVELNVRDGARAIATVLQPAAGGQDYPWLAGAVFVRDSRADIRRLEDVRGKRVVALSPLALGGWLSAVREWHKVGIHEDQDFSNLRFVFSYAKVIRAVCDGAADVGILSTVALTQVRASCGSQLRVLPSIAGGRDPRYPETISTELYPEEAFAVVGNVPEALVSQVEIALLAIELDSAVARAATVAGFTAPMSYADVQRLMEELRLRPFESFGRPTFRQIIEHHGRKLLAVLLVFLIALAWALLLTRRLNARLTTAEGFRKRVFEASRVPVVVMDADTGKYVDCNPAAVAIYGHSSQAETLQKTLLDVSAPVQYDGGASSEQMPQHLDRALLYGTTEFQWRHQRPDGAIWDAKVHLMSFEAENRRLLQFTLEDITLQKRAEADRARLEEQLRQSQKMEAIGRLAGGIAHDFNNMLTVILGYAALTMETLPRDARQQKYLGEIEKAGNRSKDITQKLLGFSRQQIIAPVASNLNDLLDDLQEPLGRLIGEDIELTFKPGKELQKVLVDHSQVNQILLNLVVNARDAMPRGGKLTIETANVTVSEADFETQTDATPGRYVLLAVSDTGVGIDKQTQARIFEPFFTTKGPSHGTGLGLATVYGIVKQNGGFVNVCSEPGCGTTFRIFLPGMDGNAVAEGIPAAATPAAGSGTILLVEDDDMVREMTVSALESIGYTPLVAKSPQEALELCLRHGSQIRLMLTDVVMPEMNGMELRDLIWATHPGIRVLLMSGYTSSVIENRGILKEGVSFIQKPFRIDELGRRIAEILAGNPV
jgi:PAS domain S-box-containing protein